MKIIDGVCYLSLDDEEVSKNTEIRKIIIPEGCSNIGIGYISNLPNLEEIEFPSTLEMIWKSAIINCPKLTMDGLKFKNNKFSFQDIKSISMPNDSTLMQDYKKKMISIFYDEGTPFEEKYNIYNQIVLTMNEAEQLEFSNSFVNEIVKNNNSLSMVINKLANGALLNSADLQIFSIYIQGVLNLSFQPIILTDSNQKVACARTNNLVDVGYRSLVSHSKRRVPDRKDIVLIDTFMLYAILHEFQHIRQRKSAENVNSEDLLTQLDYVDSLIQTTSDRYKSGPGYSNFHDYSPDEIRADLDAYDLLITIISSFEDQELKFKMIEYIEERKLNRIKAAHQIDESGNIGIYDYRFKAFNDLLSRTDLSSSEREKLDKLNELYLKILEKSKDLGIDIFSSEIEWYDSHSKSSINNNINFTSLDGVVEQDEIKARKN